MIRTGGPMRELRRRKLPVWAAKNPRPGGPMMALVFLVAGLAAGCQGQQPREESGGRPLAAPPPIEEARVVLRDFGVAVRAGDLARARTLCYGSEAAEELLKAYVEVWKSSDELEAALSKIDLRTSVLLPSHGTYISSGAVCALGGPEAGALGPGAHNDYGMSSVSLKPDGNRKITVIFDIYRLCRMAAREGQWKVELESGDRPVSAKNRALMLAAFRQIVSINRQVLAGASADVGAEDVGIGDELLDVG